MEVHWRATSAAARNGLASAYDPIARGDPSAVGRAAGARSCQIVRRWQGAATGERPSLIACRCRPVRCSHQLLNDQAAGDEPES